MRDLWNNDSYGQALEHVAYGLSAILLVAGFADPNHNRMFALFLALACIPVLILFMARASNGNNSY